MGGVGGWAGDPALAPFARGFDPLEFSARTLKGGASSAFQEGEALKRALGVIRGYLGRYVAQHCDDLLESAQHVNEAEKGLYGLFLASQYLKSASGRWQAELRAAESDLASRIAALSHAMDAAGAAAAFAQLVKHADRVRQEMDAVESALTAEPSVKGALPAALRQGLARAARLAADAAHVAESQKLKRVPAADPYRSAVADAERRIHTLAQGLFDSGLRTGSQADIGDAVTVFRDLGKLPDALEALLRRCTRDVDRGAEAAFDTRPLGPAPGSATLLGSAGLRPLAASEPAVSPEAAAGAVERVQSLLARVQQGALWVWRVQRILQQSRDSPGYSGGRGESLSARFWADATQSVRSRLSKALAGPGGGALRETLALRASKVLQSAEGVFLALSEEAPPEWASEGALFSAGDAEAFLAVFAPVQDAYVAGVAARLSDRVQAAMPDPGRGTLPPVASMQRVVAEMHDAVRSSQGSATLSEGVAHQIASALRTLVARSEALADDPVDISDISGPCTPAQAASIQLFGCLQEVHRGIEGLSSSVKVGDAAATVLASAAADLEASACQLVAPMYHGYLERLESHVCDMHGSEGPSAAASGAVTRTSAFVTQIAATLSKCHADLFSRFSPPVRPSQPSLGLSIATHLASRLLTLLLRHTCMLRYDLRQAPLVTASCRIAPNCRLTPTQGRAHGPDAAPEGRQRGRGPRVPAHRARGGDRARAPGSAGSEEDTRRGTGAARGDRQEGRPASRPGSTPRCGTGQRVPPDAARGDEPDDEAILGVDGRARRGRGGCGSPRGARNGAGGRRSDGDTPAAGLGSASPLQKLTRRVM